MELASQTLHQRPLLSPASEMQSTCTKDVTMLSHMPALVLGRSRAVAKLGLAPRATVVLSRAAVSDEFISAVWYGSRHGDLPMRRTTHPCLAGLTAIATTIFN